MHPELALQLVRVRRAELDRAARNWVRDHPQPRPTRSASGRVRHPSLSLRRIGRAFTPWRTGPAGIAPAGPG